MLIVVCCVVVRLWGLFLCLMFALILVGLCVVSCLFSSFVSVVVYVCLCCVAWLFPSALLVVAGFDVRVWSC